MLKRTVSLRRFFWVPITHVLVEKNNVQFINCALLSGGLLHSGSMFRLMRMLLRNIADCERGYSWVEHICFCGGFNDTRLWAMSGEKQLGGFSSRCYGSNHSAEHLLQQWPILDLIQVTGYRYKLALPATVIFWAVPMDGGHIRNKIDRQVCHEVFLEANKQANNNKKQQQKCCHSSIIYANPNTAVLIYVSER